MNPRPHWLSNVLCLAIVATLIWLNMAAKTDFFSKSIQECYGWPSKFLFIQFPDKARFIVFTPFILNAVAWLALIILPTVTLNGLLRRTLHIRLVSAVVLMLLASAFLWWSLNAVRVQSMNDGLSDSDLMRVLVGRLLIGLAALSAVVLISGKMLRREE